MTFHQVQLQSGGRVIYVPVPTPFPNVFGSGGTFPLGSNNFNQFGAGSSLGGFGGSGLDNTGFNRPGFSNTNNFGTSNRLNPNADPFNPNLSNLGFNTDSNRNNFDLSNNNRRPTTSTNNPFGFNFGKQTSGDQATVDLETKEEDMKASCAKNIRINHKLTAG